MSGAAEQDARKREIRPTSGDAGVPGHWRDSETHHLLECIESGMVRGAQSQATSWEGVRQSLWDHGFIRSVDQIMNRAKYLRRKHKTDDTQGRAWTGECSMPRPIDQYRQTLDRIYGRKHSSSQPPPPPAAAMGQDEESRAADAVQQAHNVQQPAQTAGNTTSNVFNMEAQKFCLKWDGFQSSVTAVFDHLRQDGELVDVTLCCEGQRVQAHRVILSACSPYFRELFKELSGQQLVVFLKDTSAADLTAIVEFMYKGSVNVAQSQLASFMKTAEMLQVQGLSGWTEDADPPPSPAPPPPPETGQGWSQHQDQHQQLASSTAGLRRATDAAGSPAEPRRKRRRAERRASPPPPPPPPPPCPAPAAAAVAGADVSRPEETPQELPAAGQFENVVKVEKFDVDLTLGDEKEGGGIEDALCHVAHDYEGYDPGSDQSRSADGQLFATAAGDAGVS